MLFPIIAILLLQSDELLSNVDLVCMDVITLDFQTKGNFHKYTCINITKGNEIAES